MEERSDEYKDFAKPFDMRLMAYVALQSEVQGESREDRLRAMAYASIPRKDEVLDSARIWFYAFAKAFKGCALISSESRTISLRFTRAVRRERIALSPLEFRSNASNGCILSLIICL
jgi:hypothetical protein